MDLSGCGSGVLNARSVWNKIISPQRPTDENMFTHSLYRPITYTTKEWLMCVVHTYHNQLTTPLLMTVPVRLTTVTRIIMTCTGQTYHSRKTSYDCIGQTYHCMKTSYDSMGQTYHSGKTTYDCMGQTYHSMKTF